MPINYKDYPPNWKEIRSRILARSGDKCEHCGITNGFVFKNENGVKRPPGAQDWDMIHTRIRYSQDSYAGSLKYHGFTRVVLTIAHLDHDKHNWNVQDDRLAALCQSCHLKYDLPRHVENRKYGRNFRKDQLKLTI